MSNIISQSEKSEVNFPLIETPNYVQISKDFQQELILASQKEITSLPFIKNPLPTTPLASRGDLFQVFVIGGTQGTIAHVQAEHQGRFTILRQHQISQLPVFDTDEFFAAYILQHLAPQTMTIGINFAYELEPVVGDHGELDGIMRQGKTKGRHAFAGLQGKQVGKTISKYIKEKTGIPVVVTVGNDTVCLAIAGSEETNDRQYIAAGIVGTGYNFAFFSDYNTIINVQASDYTSTGIPFTSSGKVVDKNSPNPGKQLFNKEVAAEPLFQHYNAYIDLLGLHMLPIRSPEELSALAEKSGNFREAQLARELFHRSASLVAAQFAGFYRFKGQPEQLTFVMEGSLFWKGPQYKEIVQQQLKQLGVPENAIVFREMQNSGVLGATKLVLG